MAAVCTPTTRVASTDARRAGNVVAHAERRCRDMAMSTMLDAEQRRAATGQTRSPNWRVTTDPETRAIVCRNASRHTRGLGIASSRSTTPPRRLRRLPFQRFPTVVSLEQVLVNLTRHCRYWCARARRARRLAIAPFR